METITYRINGRVAALEVDRLYRCLVDGRLAVRIGNGTLRDASPEEIAAVGTQSPALLAPATPPAIPDFTAMSKTELEAWAKHAGNVAGNGPVSADITWHGDRAAHFVNHMMSGGASLIDDTGVIEGNLDDTAAIPTS